MGSDSIEKSHDGYFWKRRIRKAMLPITVAAAAALVVLSFSSFFRSHGHKMSEAERSISNRGDGADTATTTTIAPGGGSAASAIVPQHSNSHEHSPIPPQCHAILQKVMTCQHSTSSQETIVFACHRKWCNSIQPLSHCETVNGIGDRTKHMLSMFSDASLDKCLRVELDYPQEQNGVELRFGDDFEYRDKWGVVAEMFHFRSYDVSDLKVNVDEWGEFDNKEQRQQKALSSSSSSSSLLGKDGRNMKKKQTFVHFIPSHDQYQFHKYDPCLYHILFKPTSKLETELQYYSDLMKIENGNVLGMHLRTGDLTAFGLHNKDIRASSSALIDSYDAMMSCAKAHAKKLGIQPKKDGDKINIFLATDNQIIKEKAKNDRRFKIFMTEDKPTAYVRSEGDRSAYTDLYLLSKTRGLVVNELPDKYDGPAEKVSTFAQLAMSIGFMDENQLHRCKLN